MIGDRSTRAAVAAYVQAHRDASHRAIARQLGVSASTVDRACRELRQATHSACGHGRVDAREAGAPDALADAPRGASPDRDTTASQSASRAAGSDAPWRANVVELRPRQAEDDAPGDAPAPAPEAVTQPGDTEQAEPWVCSYCAWRQAVSAVDRCEFGGWPRSRTALR